MRLSSESDRRLREVAQMRIHSWEIKVQGDIQEISAIIDDFRLWFRVPKSIPVSHAGDPFLAAALLPAMAKGEKLEFDESLPVSPKLLRNCSVFQDIHHTWNPVLKIVPIDAATRAAGPLNDGAMSFFSGGVDSMFTFLKRRDELTHVVYIQGFDFRVDDVSYRTAFERNASFVRGFGKTVIPVGTNSNAFGYHHNLSILLTQGSALASIALLLAFPRSYVSSAYSYSQLVPLGSHPLTDPLWSTEGVEIIHEGAEARRVEKIIKIAENPSALANLLVCAHEVVHNCGKCEKCLRTMIPLQSLGVSTTAFPPFPSLSKIKKILISNDIEMIFFKENYDLATRTGDKALRAALKSCLRRHEWTRLFKDIDKVVLGGFLKRAYRRVRKDPPSVHRVSMIRSED
jgi:hypothetical protein